jgi:thiol-disulfide isomerase/thioredoxin
VIAPVEPPPPPASLADLFGNVLLNADGDSLSSETIADKELIAIYFEGNWCSACQAFTPVLMSTYAELTLAGESFEVVFASFDVNTEELLEHMTNKGMLWLAVHPDAEKITSLAQRYAVQFIPKLVVLDSDLNTITLAGRDDVVLKGAAAYDDWVASIGGT